MAASTFPGALQRLLPLCASLMLGSGSWLGLLWLLVTGFVSARVLGLLPPAVHAVKAISGSRSAQWLLAWLFLSIALLLCWCALHYLLRARSRRTSSALTVPRPLTSAPPTPPSSPPSSSHHNPVPLRSILRSASSHASCPSRVSFDLVASPPRPPLPAPQFTWERTATQLQDSLTKQKFREHGGEIEVDVIQRITERPDYLLDFPIVDLERELLRRERYWSCERFVHQSRAQLDFHQLRRSEA